MSSSRQEGGRQLLSSRILSRDRSSVANASFRVYYSLAAAGTVPFVWETKPGMPKATVVVPAAAAHDDDDAPPPMISPPPSYQSRAKKRCSRPPPSSSSSWPSRGGWITSGWLSIRRRLRLSPSSQQQQPNDRDLWLIRPDHGVDDDGHRHRRRPRRAVFLCF